MTRRERLMASLKGMPVDRPAVSFYEIGGFNVDPSNPDPFNIYNDPSWHDLLSLAEEKTDLIRMRGSRTFPRNHHLRDQFFSSRQWCEGSTRWNESRVEVAGVTLRQVDRRDAAIDTTWTIEHLLKTEDDVRAYLQIPDEALELDCDCKGIIEEDERIGDRGIVMIDTGDPLCSAASMMSMEDYTVLALTNPSLFHQLLQKMARRLWPLVEEVSRQCPGHLWRICGAEYAGEPYLPPHLFEEYVVAYSKPMVEAIHRYGGYARIHCHGRLKNVLPHIMKLGADATDPIEPPPQGDVNLIDVRRTYGEQLTLFGNIEASEIELLPPDQFERRIAQAIREGTAGKGRGFVLLPSSCPYGRTITSQTMQNYQTMVRMVENA